MRAIAVKEFRELRRDRRTLAMLFLLPFLFLVVFGYAASFDIKDVPTVVVGAAAQPVASALPGTFDVVATFEETFVRLALARQDVTPTDPERTSQ